MEDSALDKGPVDFDNNGGDNFHNDENEQAPSHIEINLKDTNKHGKMNTSIELNLIGLVWDDIIKTHPGVVQLLGDNSVLPKTI